MVSRFRTVLTGTALSVLLSPDLALACKVANPCKSQSHSGLVVPAVIAALFVARIAWLRWTDIPPIQLASDDPDVIRAKQAARDSIGRFWTAFEEQRPGTDLFALKVALPTAADGCMESIWVGEISRRSSGTFGRILNYPLHEKYESGQVIALDGLTIDDWSYVDGEEAQGHFLTRVMIGRAPRRAARRMMKDLGWSSTDLAAPRFHASQSVSA